MTAPPFDTLDLFERLQSGGFSREQADTLVKALATASHVDLSALATKSDIAPLASKADLAEMKADLLKWALPILLGQSALIATLVKLL